MVNIFWIWIIFNGYTTGNVSGDTTNNFDKLDTLINNMMIQVHLSIYASMHPYIHTSIMYYDMYHLIIHHIHAHLWKIHVCKHTFKKKYARLHLLSIVYLTCNLQRCWITISCYNTYPTKPLQEPVVAAKKYAVLPIGSRKDSV